MQFETDTVAATGRTAIVVAVHRWLQLDTDWKSVVLAATIVGLIVGFDVTVPT